MAVIAWSLADTRSDGYGVLCLSLVESIKPSCFIDDSHHHMACICDREFAKSIPRPFSVRYNPYTESIEVIKDKPSIQKVISDIKYSVDVLQDAMGKMK